MEYLDRVKQKKKIAKVVIIGSGGVGKTSLLKVLKTNTLLQGVNESYHRTLFMEIETIRFNDSDIAFVFMDLAGQLDLPMHALKDFQRLSLGSTDLIILMFANDNLTTLLDLQQWFSLLHTYYKKINQPLPTLLLIQNKIDMDSRIDSEILSALKSAVTFVDHLQLSLITGDGLDKFLSILKSFGGK